MMRKMLISLTTVNLCPCRHEYRNIVVVGITVAIIVHCGVFLYIILCIVTHSCILVGRTITIFIAITMYLFLSVVLLTCPVVVSAL